MITTYSYLDQYKQIGFAEPIDYFIQFVETPFPLSIVISESLEYSIVLSESNEHGIVLSQSNEYGISL